MNNIVKNTLLNSLLSFVLIVAVTSASAALYRGVDADGSVVYSDTPFEDAEKFTPPPISVVDRPKIKNENKPQIEEKPAEFKYLDFDISSPAYNATIRNEIDLEVTLKLKPGLNTDKNHSIWMLVDGNVVVKKSQKLQVRIGRLDRGAHKLQAQIRDESGAIIVRTRTSVVFIQQTSAN